MEYKELETLWKQYGEKLDNLEKLNKKLLKNTLLQKPQKKLKWLEFSSIYGVIVLPIIFLVALHPNFKVENIDRIFILGCTLTFIVILYICVKNLEIHLIAKKINLSSDTIMQSLDKIIKIKKIADNYRKYVFLYYPVLCAGVVFIGWNSSVFSAGRIIYLIALFLITYFLNIWGGAKYKERINELEKDIIELKEYTEE